MKWKLGKVTYEFDRRKCGCGTGWCVEACGQDVIDFSERSKKMKVVNLNQCIICRQCEEICPKGAIAIQGALTLKDIFKEMF